MPFLDSISSTSSWWAPGTAEDIPDELLVFPEGTVFLSVFKNITPTSTPPESDIPNEYFSYNYSVGVRYNYVTTYSLPSHYYIGGDSQNNTFTINVDNNRGYGAQVGNAYVNATTNNSGGHSGGNLSSYQTPATRYSINSYVYTTNYASSYHSHSHSSWKFPSITYQTLYTKPKRLRAPTKYGPPGAVIMSANSNSRGKQLRELYPDMIGDFYVAFTPGDDTIWNKGDSNHYVSSDDANSIQYTTLINSADSNTTAISHIHTYASGNYYGFRQTYSYAYYKSGSNESYAGAHEHQATGSYQVKHVNATRIWKAFVQDEYFRPSPDMIVLFDGDITDLPRNWKVCNGLNGTPDLRGGIMCWNSENRYANDTKRSASGYSYAQLDDPTPIKTSHAHTGSYYSFYAGNVQLQYTSQRTFHNSINYDHQHTRSSTTANISVTDPLTPKKYQFKYIQFKYPL